MKCKNIILAVVFFSINLTTFAQSNAPKLIAQDGKWSAYEIKESGKKVCYMVSSPSKEEGTYTRRGKVYAMVTHRPAEKSFNVVSFHAGYGFAPGATIDVAIGKNKFKMFTEAETAWASNDLDDAIVSAIKGGNQVVVKGKSSRGTQTTDTYSLKGSSRIYKAMSKSCGVSG